MLHLQLSYSTPEGFIMTATLDNHRVALDAAARIRADGCTVGSLALVKYPRRGKPRVLFVWYGDESMTWYGTPQYPAM